MTATRSEPRFEGRTLLFAVLAVAAVFYSISSIEYFINYDAKTETLWDQVFSAATSESFATGSGSAAGEMRETYAANRIALQLHATTGAIMLATGILQFSTAFRRRRPGLHRNLGRVWVALAIPTTGGSLAYLASVPMDEVFSGRVFYAALVGLALALALATFLAYTTARRRQFAAHRAWMLQAYFYILSAPILRLTWLAAYRSSADLDEQWDANLYTTSLTTAAIAMGPLVVLTLSRQPHRLRAVTAGRQVRAVLPERASAAFVATGLLVVVAGTMTSVDTRFGAAWPGNVITVGLMAIVVGLFLHRVTRRHDLALTGAWALMAAAVALLPVTTAVVTGLTVQFGWDLADAFPAAGLAALFVNPLVAYAWFVHGGPDLGMRAQQDEPSVTEQPPAKAGQPAG